MGWKFLKFFGENRLEFVEKWMVLNIWGMISTGQRNLRKLRAKLSAFGPKKENFEKFQEKFAIFWSKSLWKIDFEQFFAKYFLEFCLHSESIYHWKITAVCYYKFPDFEGGTFRCSIYIYPYIYIYITNTKNISKKLQVHKDISNHSRVRLLIS